MDENFLTAQEVADILRVKKTTVYDMIKRGDLVSQKIGKQIRISASDIQQIVQPKRKVDEYSKPSEEVHSNQIVLCGQDSSLDIIANHISTIPNMPSVLRSQAGSYNSLYKLYQRKVDIATAHLWDEETQTYNTTYVEKLVPGTPVIIVRLLGRSTGFYVKSGNPLNITGFSDFKRADISIVNREKGSGARVLLDEKLKKMYIPTKNIKGYQNEHTSHLSVASAVSRGEGDVGIGISTSAMQIKNIDFIPLQNEWYDMVFLAEMENSATFREIIDFVSSARFINEISQFGDYDLSQTGRIIKRSSY